MKRARDKSSAPPPTTAGRLSGVRSLAHDEDDRPSREDRSYGETIFNRATVPLPRFLRPRRKASER